MRGCAHRFDFGRSALADDVAPVDDDDAVCEGVGFFQVMRGEQDGFAAGGEAADLGPEAAAGFDVEADGGLVEEDDVGIAGESEGEKRRCFCPPESLAEHAVFDSLEAGGLDDFGVGHGVG